MPSRKNSKTARENRQTAIRSALVERIYAAINNPAEWTSVLKDLITSTNSRSARMLVMNREATEVFSSYKLNIDDDCHRNYVDYYVNTCPWRKELPLKKQGQLYSTSLHFSCRQSEFYRSEFFNDWARPQDIHHGVCGTIYKDSSQSVQLLIQRTRGQGYYTEDDTFFVNTFMPHLKQAFLLTAQLEQSRSAAQAITRAAEGKKLPFLLLDISAKIIYCSGAAEKLLAAEPLLKIKDRQLRPQDQTAGHSLQDLIQKSLLIADTRAFDAPGGNIEVPRPGRASLNLFVRPIHPDATIVAEAPRSYVAIYLHDPEAGYGVDGDELSRFYSLSKAETRVAMEMLFSANPAEAAERCCISLNTLRSHLKAIFTKTNTHSQSGLIKLLLTGPFRRR